MNQEIELKHLSCRNQPADMKAPKELCAPFLVCAQTCRRQIDNSHYRLCIGRVPSFSQALLSFTNAIPGGTSSLFFGRNGLIDLKQISKDSHLTAAGIVSQSPLCINVRAEVLFRDSSCGAGFFLGFAGGAFSGREAGIEASLGEGPFSRTGLHQQELHGGLAAAEAHRCNLNRQLCSRPLPFESSKKSPHQYVTPS